MSCNGCRVLRKGCSDACVLRPSIQWIDGSDSQAHATAFVAKFFGRAALLSSLSAAPLSQRPVVFRSLLFEACGRTINPVSGAVGLLAARNWDTCQAAVETVLRGGAPKRMADAGADFAGELFGSGSERSERSSGPPPACELELGLTATPSESSATTSEESGADRAEKRRLLDLFV